MIFCVQKRMPVDCKNRSKYLRVDVLCLLLQTKLPLQCIDVCTYQCFEYPSKYTLQTTQKGSFKNTSAYEAIDMSQKTNFVGWQRVGIANKTTEVKSGRKGQKVIQTRKTVFHHNISHYAALRQLFEASRGCLKLSLQCSYYIERFSVADK